ncbi:MAG: DUF3035 domain-containing protein [Alphaproteobacteria bacterium]
MISIKHLLACGGIGLLLGGCGGLSDLSSIVSGTSKNVDDIDLAVKNAPLTLPPDYSLRPPPEGTGRTQSVQATRQARTVLTSNPTPTGIKEGERSPGEQLLLRNAGKKRDITQDVVKRTIDVEEKNEKDTEKTFVDKVMNYNDKAPETTQGNTDTKSAVTTKPTIKKKDSLF